MSAINKFKIDGIKGISTLLTLTEEIGLECTTDQTKRYRTVVTPTANGIPQP